MTLEIKLRLLSEKTQFISLLNLYHYFRYFSDNQPLMELPKLLYKNQVGFSPQKFDIFATMLRDSSANLLLVKLQAVLTKPNSLLDKKGETGPFYSKLPMQIRHSGAPSCSNKTQRISPQKNEIGSLCSEIPRQICHYWSSASLQCSPCLCFNPASSSLKCIETGDLSHIEEEDRVMGV
ncbi:hypothetical protein AMTR_s00097p00140040 [Amborella trichopoda]|uniref:Uncharacterized protein n=1 Tax=Amborella trichopoda TaxID=13333 RepID=W1P2G5_AMBTC|nr:hypothetical protein AMTR_s00097p00140040 [Amborella trichopoda]